jgi:hypothetical protein
MPDACDSKEHGCRLGYRLVSKRDLSCIDFDTTRVAQGSKQRGDPTFGRLTAEQRDHVNKVAGAPRAQMILQAADDRLLNSSNFVLFVRLKPPPSRRSETTNSM